MSGVPGSPISATGYKQVLGALLPFIRPDALEEATDAILRLASVASPRRPVRREPFGDCAECGARTRRTAARPEVCQECHRRARYRERRRGDYHASIKTDPEAKAEHNRQAREGMERWRRRNGMEAGKPGRKPKAKPTPSSEGREVTFDVGVRVYLRRVPHANTANAIPAGQSDLHLRRELQADLVQADAPRPRADAPVHRHPATQRVSAGNAGGRRKAGRKDGPTDARPAVTPTDRRATLNSCPWCMRKFRGEGFYCSDEHEALAAKAQR